MVDPQTFGGRGVKKSILTYFHCKLKVGDFLEMKTFKVSTRMR